MSNYLCPSCSEEFYSETGFCTDCNVAMEAQVKLIEPQGSYYQTTRHTPHIVLGTHLWEFLWALRLTQHDISEIICKMVRLGRDGRDPLDCAHRARAMCDVLIERLELEKEEER